MTVKARPEKLCFKTNSTEMRLVIPCSTPVLVPSSPEPLSAASTVEIPLSCSEARELLTSLHCALKEFLIQKRNVLIEAPKGMGKTALLRAFMHLHQKEFCIFYIKKSKDIKPALLEILYESGAPKPKNATIPELQSMVKALLQDMGKNKPVIIFLDHLEDGHLKTEELLMFLEESQICFAGAASELKERLGRYFRERIKLEPLKEEDASKLVRLEMREKLCMDAPESFVTLVLRKSSRVPFFIKDILREVETQNQLQEFDFRRNPDHASQVVERMAPHPMLNEIEEKIDILPVWTVFIIAYLFLAFRYIAMVQGIMNFS